MCEFNKFGLSRNAMKLKLQRVSIVNIIKADENAKWSEW